MLQNNRRCVSCRKADHKSAFWRVVRVFSSHQVQLDQGMGRSVYLCPQESCLQAAQKKDRLGRSLKTAVPEEIYQILWQRLAIAGDGVEAVAQKIDPNHSSPIKLNHPAEKRQEAG